MSHRMSHPSWIDIRRVAPAIKIHLARQFAFDDEYQQRGGLHQLPDLDRGCDQAERPAMGLREIFQIVFPALLHQRRSPRFHFWLPWIDHSSWIPCAGKIGL